MSKSRLAVIAGGCARERISNEILQEICKPEFNQERVAELVAQLSASPKPALQLVTSNAGRKLSSKTPAKNADNEEKSP